MLDLQTELDCRIVESALQSTLESSVFRSSRQCQQLLRYIVANSLAHRDASLRERVIGIEVFGRAPDYDTGNDPVVRARVAEVRKRLAQYYLEHRDKTAIHISIPSGSYKAVFTPQEKSNSIRSLHEDTVQAPFPHKLEPASAVEAAHEARKADRQVLPISSSKRKLKRLIPIGVIAAIVLLAGVFLVHKGRQWDSNMLYSRFWEPVVKDTHPAIIYVGANYTYRLSSSYLDSYRAEHQLENTGPEIEVQLKPTDSISGKDLILTRKYTGWGDVAATARVVSTLTRFEGRYDLRYGEDIATTDLHASPTILIGGFSNPWTMQLTHGLRYTLEQGDRIVDHNDKNKAWQVNSQDDYAVLSRLVNSQTAGFALVIAGIGTAGTQAAADFASSPEHLGKLLANAPAGWERMNMQVVLHTTKLNRVPLATDVQAVYFW